MKEYPIDKWGNVMFWPMEKASSVKSKPLKLLLVLSYFVWVFLLMPITAPLLFLSIAMSIWDDVNVR